MILQIMINKIQILDQRNINLKMIKDKDSKQSIQVTIRVRPLSQKQLMEDSRTCVTVQQQNRTLHILSGGDVKKFTFDSISYNETQQDIFEKVGRKSTMDCLEGYNCTIFAYGQTGAGKTYTMMGVGSDHQDYYNYRGLIPRTLEYLFESIEQQKANGQKFIIRCSFLEIYNQQIIDLMNKVNNNLQLREDARKGVYVQGLSDQQISTPEQAMTILQKGSKSRHIGSTYYNQSSSRSHSVFIMSIQSKYSKNGVLNTKTRQFNFIDLAGSERTKLIKGERLKEGCKINSSLSSLAHVINQLSQSSEGKPQHIKYRDSKLTFLLKDSLGGNSKTNLIANISPATIYCQQSLSTLGFARRAKFIKMQKASINEESTGNLDSMKNEIKRLKQEVITLMSRNPNELSVNTIEGASDSKMTGIMHQYVSEEIDKQTKLEIELMKLKEIISHLQTGIKKYSSSETNLRLIISIYEDKFKRLKQIEDKLIGKIEELNFEGEQSKKIVDYVAHERKNLLSQIQVMKQQKQGLRSIKQILKLKLCKEDSTQDENLKDMLFRNNSFLQEIQSKLSEIHPQKIQVQFNEDFEKKIVEVQKQYLKKQEEYQERIEQMNIEISIYNERIEENQRVLEDAVNTQTSLEEKINFQKEEYQRLIETLKIETDKNDLLENQKKNIIQTHDQIVSQLKITANKKEIQFSHVQKQNEEIKLKLSSEEENMAIIKQQFVYLQVQKCKVDKLFIEKTEQTSSIKSQLMKAETQIRCLLNQVQTFKKEKQEEKESKKKLKDILDKQREQYKIEIKELNEKFIEEISKNVNKNQNLVNTIQQMKISHHTLQQSLKNQKKELEELKQEFQNLEQSKNEELESKEQKISELITLLSAKQENNYETSHILNQVKLDLINAKNERQLVQSKMNKTVQNLKEKLEKEIINSRNLQQQIEERSKIYQRTNQDLLLKKRQSMENQDLKERFEKKVNQLKTENQEEERKIDQINNQLKISQDRQKQLKLELFEAKNQLLISQKNAELEVDSLKTTLYIKLQHIEQLKKLQFSDETIKELKKKVSFSDETIEGLKNNIEQLQSQLEKQAIEKKKCSEMAQALQQQIQMIKVSQQQAESKFVKTQLQIEKIQKQLKRVTSTHEANQKVKSDAQEKFKKISLDLDEKIKQNKGYSQINQSLKDELTQERNKIEGLTTYIEQFKEKVHVDNEKSYDYIQTLKKEKIESENQKISLKNVVNKTQIENNFFKQKISLYQTRHIEFTKEINTLIQQKSSLRSNVQQFEQQNKHLIFEKEFKDKINHQLSRQKQVNTSLKMIIDNMQQQKNHLQFELQQKDSVYKKLVEKIARNQGDNKKTMNSDQYQKTVDLLQTTRWENKQLKNSNEEYKKSIASLRSAMEDKQAHAVQVQKRSEIYCISIHKRMEEIQNDYLELERKQENILKEKKQLSQQNEHLKSETKNLSLKNDEIEKRLKNSNIDFIGLEKEIEKYRRGHRRQPSDNISAEESYTIINKLKSQNSALKAQRNVLKDALSKEKQEKCKLKSEIRYGRDNSNELAAKSELEKKIHENKNLQQLVLDIANLLKIVVNEPKTKFETIRSVIIGTIKQKNNQISVLKDKIQEYEQDLQKYQGMEMKTTHKRRESKDFKALGLKNVNAYEDNSMRYSKQKNFNILNNTNRQKIRQIQNKVKMFSEEDPKIYMSRENLSNRYKNN